MYCCMLTEMMMSYTSVFRTMMSYRNCRARDQATMYQTRKQHGLGEISLDSLEHSVHTHAHVRLTATPGLTATPLGHVHAASPTLISSRGS